MRVFIGTVGAGGPWRVEVEAPNVQGKRRQFSPANKAAAERLALQLAGGRKDRIVRTVFVTSEVLAALPTPPRPTPLVVDDPADEADDLAANEVDVNQAAGLDGPHIGTAPGVVAVDAGEVADLLVQSAKAVVAEITAGTWDPALGIVETYENRRAGGGRVTVLRAIAARRSKIEVSSEE
jgi:hypothetical protein